MWDFVIVWSKSVNPRISEHISQVSGQQTEEFDGELSSGRMIVAFINSLGLHLGRELNRIALFEIRNAVAAYDSDTTDMGRVVGCG